MGLADPADPSRPARRLRHAPKLRETTAGGQYRVWIEATAERLPPPAPGSIEAAREEDWLRGMRCRTWTPGAAGGRGGARSPAPASRAAAGRAARRGDRRSPGRDHSARPPQPSGPAAALRAASRALQRLLPSPSDPPLAKPTRPRRRLSARRQRWRRLTMPRRRWPRRRPCSTGWPVRLRSRPEACWSRPRSGCSRCGRRRASTASPWSSCPTLLAELRGRLASLEDGNAQLDGAANRR